MWIMSLTGEPSIIFIEFIPFEFFVRPRLKSYLESVLGGLKWHVVNQKTTPRNHFGKLAWFS